MWNIYIFISIYIIITCKSLVSRPQVFLHFCCDKPVQFLCNLHNQRNISPSPYNISVWLQLHQVARGKIKTT